ncbi:hypothetical protein Tco_0638778, partial [Tanacetum coccineum]
MNNGGLVDVEHMDKWACKVDWKYGHEESSV